MRLTGIFCMCVCASLLLPEPVWAWGPGVHMVTGNWVLQNLAYLPQGVAALLMAYPGRFLHGCLSADIFIGKGCKAKKGHSHNWESGLVLASQAVSPASQAYALGYLAHLASDTVAHNVFVPGLFHTAPSGGRFAHVYLEAQADRQVAWDSRDAVGVFHERGSGAALSMLRSSMHQKALLFWLKAQIFKGSIAVGGSETWRRSMNLLDGFTPGRERVDILDAMLIYSTRAIVDVLRFGEHSGVLSLDPIGETALARAEASKKRRSGNQASAARIVTAFGKIRRKRRGRSPRLLAELPAVLTELPSVCPASHPPASDSST